jgi:hypothetical protein
LAGAFIMVSWDVAMDPYQSTVTGDWIWRDGGGYFGVPLHNYAGWFGTVFMFMLVYFIFASRYAEQPQEDLMQNRTAFWKSEGCRRQRGLRGRHMARQTAGSDVRAVPRARRGGLSDLLRLIAERRSPLTPR